MNILIRFKDLLVESLRDNKKLIIGLYVLFIVLFIVAWVLSGDMMQSVLNRFPASGLRSPADMTGVSAAELFIHNEWGGIVTYVSSIFFAIPAIVILVYNAVNLGLFGQMFSNVLPNGALFYICYLIPHGIFEITAMVLQSAAGVILFRFIWGFVKAWRSSQTQGVSDAFEMTKGVLVQSIILMIFSTILLLIAAPIEAYVSVPLSEWIVGI